MRKTVVKISVVLVVIIFLPIGFFLVNELTKLSQNEQMVENVFNKQLESILFSINQYSENVISYWINNLDLPLDCESVTMEGVATNMLSNNPSIQQISFMDIETERNKVSFGRDSTLSFKTLNSEENIINRLVENLKKDYQKIETRSLNEETILFFVMKNQNANVLCVISVHTESFIQGLGSQIQQVSQELFYISVQDTVSGNIVFATEGSTDENLELQEVSMWYLPTYKIGIRLLSSTIKELVLERGQKGRYILWSLVIVVLIGAVFVLGTIRKEVRLAELKSGFVSNVSHEIRTPLALISIYAESLKLKRVKPEKQDKYLDTIYSESVKLSEIVNRVLNFSKIENNKKVFDIKPYSVNELIVHTLDSYAPHFEENEVEIFYVPMEKEVHINADKVAVSEAITNLFDNAIKYGKPEDKRISIRSIIQNDSVIVEIEDNGIGISTKDKKHIFDKFYRVSKGDRANKVKGSGLGLNIVKQIMKNHGGNITVKSKLGEGSIFRLKFVSTKNKANA